MSNPLDLVVAREIQEIAISPRKLMAYELTCIIHANGRDIPVLAVDHLYLEQNFIVNFSDLIELKAMIGEGTYAYDVYPYRANLEVTIRRRGMGNNLNPAIIQSVESSEYRYRAYIYDTKSELIENNNPLLTNKDVTDRAKLTNIKIQLVDRLVERIRTTTVGGIFRSARGVDIIRAMLGSTCKKVATDDSVSLKGVDVAGTPNPEVRTHVVVPHLTKLTAFPHIVDDICGGVYSAGFAHYLHKQIWYLYPPYDSKSFTRTRRNLTVINVAKNRYPGSENTYRTTEGQVIVLATGETKQHDFSEQNQLEYGNGVRFVDAKQVMDGFVNVRDNRAFVNTANNINEFIGQARPDGLQVVFESVERITNNYFSEYSKLAERNGFYIQLVWENGNENILYPGMPVRYIFTPNNSTVELFGTLVGVNVFEQPSNQNIAERRFTKNIALTLFVNRNFSAEL